MWPYMMMMFNDEMHVDTPETEGLVKETPKNMSLLSVFALLLHMHADIHTVNGIKLFLHRVVGKIPHSKPFQTRQGKHLKVCILVSKWSYASYTQDHPQHLKKYVAGLSRLKSSVCLIFKKHSRIQWSACLRGFSVWFSQAEPSVWPLCLWHSESPSDPPAWMHKDTVVMRRINNDSQLFIVMCLSFKSWKT